MAAAAGEFLKSSSSVVITMASFLSSKVFCFYSQLPLFLVVSES